MFRQTLLIALLVSLLATATYAGFTCAKPCYGNMCCSIPSNNEYYLTDFCGTTSACGPTPYCSGTHYFTADSQRFGCGKYLNLCTASKKCIKAQIVDAGPAIWVEQDAGRAIIDASPSICKLLFNANSCGWSDHFSITAVLTSATDTRPLGPFNVTDTEYDIMIKEGIEAMDSCIAAEECGPVVNV
ncbi:hypothetical protein SAMD00019534_040840 [Acytostelium subglobosum LB1]|uniref:hypothetical protein n=1 Tax=Acytostelium subglobosum LB1 TaxID=1410327 RepID=UPI000644CDCC|nr:hypothetical protein SAMD00019534_040840 [Acytostelium subglobosum LB1]GAM20909.1 hypothetical protein SAMD00019534_040840 [Acytostelium subglobosum LB1]|eukprot:XP_012756043.1 hypothetical protein SAMD00019534_040840 [Acytostelium subglobosum LB1]